MKIFKLLTNKIILILLGSLLFVLAQLEIVPEIVGYIGMGLLLTIAGILLYFAIKNGIEDVLKNMDK